MGQAGQDLWVATEVFNEKQRGTFVDVGAHDGVELSNTYTLEKKYRWTGVCVEANPDTFQLLQENRTAKCVNACMDESERFVEFSKNRMHRGIVGATDEEIGEVVRLPAQTLTAVLQQCGMPTQIDYLSVDVEGAEDRVFAGLDLEKYRFTCMTVERPSTTLRSRLQAARMVLVREILSLDAFFIHESHCDQYLQNVFNYYKKRHIALRWK